MNVTFAALQGIQQASERVELAAQRLSKPPDVTAAGDIVDLSAEIVALLQAKNLNSAMVSIVKTADDMDLHLVSLLG